ncbi:50S ribosomal protein L6 [Candidatus Gracilibacteria bacterium]|nr:MAG: 50S ribosomal protein L6 [Candidatus Gracilibacteria bacterium]PIE85744.1 MAG: 50S ribosomal protein L6 [Candidatus Gracilibacteria bacterium]
MSRIGKMPINLSDKVEVKIENNNISIKGPLGSLSFDYSSNVEVVKEDNIIVVKCLNKEANSLWGTTRSVINNMVIGVTEGYKKALEINGVGYKFDLQGNKLILSIGYSHKVEMQAPEGLKLELDDKAKNILYVSGIDKQLVGQFASKIKSKKKPEPYKGKGIKYVGENIRRKAGKTGSK